MHIIRTLLISIIPFLAVINAYGQTTTIPGETSQTHASHAHVHDHDTQNYHIGIGAAATYLNKEGHLAPGFHLHFIRQFGHYRQWGLGLGFETIADEHLHNGLNLLVNYRPLPYLSLITGPGMVFGKHDGETEILPGFHTEAVFEFNLRGLHVGPMIGYGIDKEESHFSVGLHIGIGF